MSAAAGVATAGRAARGAAVVLRWPGRPPPRAGPRGPTGSPAFVCWYSTCAWSSRPEISPRLPFTASSWVWASATALLYCWRRPLGALARRVGLGGEVGVVLGEGAHELEPVGELREVLGAQEGVELRPHARCRPRRRAGPARRGRRRPRPAPDPSPPWRRRASAASARGGRAPRCTARPPPRADGSGRRAWPWPPATSAWVGGSAERGRWRAAKKGRTKSGGDRRPHEPLARPGHFPPRAGGYGKASVSGRAEAVTEATGPSPGSSNLSAVSGS